MPRISELSTEVGASTSDMVLNVGSTTRRAALSQIVGGIFTSQGQLIYAPSSRESTFLNPPSSGAVLTYSSATSAPTWSIPTTGAVLVASSAGILTWRALGTSGQVLQSTGGTPTWVDANTLTGTITTAGTSGQVLQTTVGAAAWVASNTLTGTITTAGTSGQILQTTAGAAAWRASTAVLRETLTGSGDLLITDAAGGVTRLAVGSSGDVLQTTAGAPAWRAGGAGGGTTQAFVLQNDTTQAITTAAFIAVAWNTEVLDTDAVHTTVAGSSSITVPTSGLYIFGLTFNLGSTGGMLYRFMEGTTEWARGTIGEPAAAAGAASMAAMARYFATSGAEIIPQFMARAAANSLSTTPLHTFWGHRLL